MAIEKMSDFFSARVEIYDEHMLNDVEGAADAYVALSRLVPQNVARLLDLGCGTGLELGEIWKLHPDIAVTGIDLAQAMLDKLKEKYPDKNTELICGNYFDVDLGSAAFDVAISFQTMHHFSHEDKVKLYSRVKAALKPGGQYIEADYMVTEQSQEDAFYSENRRLRREQGIAESELYHFDTPCAIENQIELLKRAGFRDARQVWRKGNTTIIVADQ